MRAAKAGRSRTAAFDIKTHNYQSSPLETVYVKGDGSKSLNRLALFSSAPPRMQSTGNVAVVSGRYETRIGCLHPLSNELFDHRKESKGRH